MEIRCKPLHMHGAKFRMGDGTEYQVSAQGYVELEDEGHIRELLASPSCWSRKIPPAPPPAAAKVLTGLFGAPVVAPVVAAEPPAPSAPAAETTIDSPPSAAGESTETVAELAAAAVESAPAIVIATSMDEVPLVPPTSPEARAFAKQASPIYDKPNSVERVLAEREQRDDKDGVWRR